MNVQLKSFMETEDHYNCRLFCHAYFIESVLEEFLRGDIPVESLVGAMNEVASQLRADGEDRRINADRFMDGKDSFRMWHGSWK